jgi:hypothetical protein
MCIGLNEHFAQQYRALMWALGSFTGPLREVEMGFVIKWNEQ